MKQLELFYMNIRYKDVLQDFYFLAYWPMFEDSLYLSSTGSTVLLSSFNNNFENDGNPNLESKLSYKNS